MTHPKKGEPKSKPKKKVSTRSRKPDMDHPDSDAIFMKAVGVLDANDVMQELKHLALSMHMLSSVVGRLAENNTKIHERLDAALGIGAKPKAVRRTGAKRSGAKPGASSRNALKH